MSRPIARRDFLNGVAIGITGVYAALNGITADAAPPSAVIDAAQYPPLRTGLRGQYPAAVEEFERIHQGKYAQFPVADAEIHEEYDLVIAGGGISGLSAAYFYKTAFGPAPRILILDNHDDFGGHAKRNEFTYQGRTFIGYGGTMGIATPYPYSYTAKRLIEELGIQVARNSEFQNRDLFQKLNLGPAMFFDKEHFGEDRVVAGNGRLPWPEFLAKAPLSDAVRKDLVRLYGKNPDYMAGTSVHPDAILFFRGQGGRNNKRVDTTPALEAARRGSAGFNGLGLEREEGFRESSYTFHFP